MQDVNQMDFLNVVVNGGVVSIGVALMLLLMSIISWYVIITKSYKNYKINKITDSYIDIFIKTSSLEQILKQNPTQSGLVRLTKFTVEASEHYLSRVSETANRNQKSYEDFIARAVRKCLTNESKRLEYGLTSLATIGSISPFIGLLGTVWGIYHALISINISGQASLDKVAGPVGEALIMTAIGLAVAIPAVIAYNHLIRTNNKLLSKLDDYGYQLHILLSTGALIRSI